MLVDCTVYNYMLFDKALLSLVNNSIVKAVVIRIVVIY